MQQSAVLIVLIGLMIATGIINAQDDPAAEDLQLVDQLMLATLQDTLEAQEDLPEDALPIGRNVTLSPDGAALAWTWNEGYCAYAIDAETLNCQTLDARLPNNMPLVWSPDSQHVAFTLDFVRLFEEPDIMVLNVATGALVNLTDDGIIDLSGDDADTPYIDVVPTWDPSTGDLYFFRYIENEAADGFDSALYRFAAPVTADTRAEPEVVVDLTGWVDGLLFPFVVTPPFLLDGAAAIAPDGRTMAALVRDIQERERTGLVLIDLETGEIFFEISNAQLTTAGMPAWYTDPGGPLSGDIVDGIAWAADKQTVLVAIQNAFFDTETLSPRTVAVDSQSGEVTPLVDFSTLPDTDSFLTGEGTLGIQARQYWVTHAAGLDALVYLAGFQPGADTLNIDRLSLTERGVETVVSFDGGGLLPQTQASTGQTEDGRVRVLVNNVLLTFAPAN
ncbi:MAG: hypothetical protein ACOCXZ_02705 [Chloroflexota bacterium]